MPEGESKMEDLISPTKAAALLGCHINTLKTWRKKNKGPRCVQIEGSPALAYSRSEVERWIQSEKKVGTVLS